MAANPLCQSSFAPRLAWQTAQVAVALMLVIGAIFVPAQKAAALPGTYWVNRTDDIAPRGAGVTCLSQASTDCTLREAVIKANANPGSTIRFDATRTNGMPIILTRSGNDATASAGDLDINANTTIIGNGATNTIIQGAADASYTGSIGDKIFGVNQDGLYPSLTVSFSGMTIRYGDNAIPYNNPDWAFTGGGVDVWQTGLGNSATFTDCVISYNRNRYGWGGGFNFDQDLSASGSLTLTNITFDHNQTTNTADASQNREGGGLAIHGYQPNVTITNSTFTYNQTTDPDFAGGGIYIGPSYMGTIAIHGTTFDHNNATTGSGGGIAIYYWSSSDFYPVNITIDQNTRVTNNTAGNTGGGIFIQGSYLNNAAQLTNLFISGNSAAEGGGIYVGLANATMQYSRIVNNTVTAGTGTGLYRNASAGTVTAENNWWGCSTGPGAAPCDTAVTVGGTLTYTPWLRDQLTSASGTTLVTNQTSTLTASFLTNSNGADVTPPLTNLNRVIGLPITWGATSGNASGDAVVNAGGTALGTYQAPAVGPSIVYALVDNDNTSPVSSNVLNVTVNKANTTTAITSHLPDPSTPGQVVTVTFTVTGQYGNSPTAPTGTVTVTDGVDSCSATVAAGSCNITLNTTGNRTLTATYIGTTGTGDANFNGSTSAGVSHTVSQAPAITSANNTTFTVGAAGSFTVMTTGFPIPGIVEAGALPGGVTFADNGNGTATLSGTPNAGTGSVYNLTFTASNGVLPDDTQNFTLTVGESPTITSANNVTFTVGAAGSFTVMTTGFPIPAISEVGALPAGMTFGDNGNGTATLSGSPNAGTVGTYPLTFTASNGVLPDDTQNFTLTVDQANTTTTIDSDVPDPSDVGETVTFSYTVSVVPPGGGMPTGDVTVSNGAQSCTATVAAGSCTITLTTLGTTNFTATYAGDANFVGSSSAIEQHTVNPASTTTTLTSDLPEPSVYGQTVTFTYTVDVVPPGVGIPTGNVTVSNGTETCTGTVAAGSCTITFIGAGTSNFTATYAGDASFAGSTSAAIPHTVNQANTTTVITSDAPDPSQVGEPVTVIFTVTALAPGAGTPTGSVTVSAGTDSCTGTVAAGSCTIAFSSLGAKTLTAVYTGDGNFNPSTSGTEAHTVTAASTLITITSDAPDPSVVGIPLPVTYTVTVVAPGGGTPTGNVTITDGVDNCTVPVAVGTCNLTLTTTGGRLLTASYSGDANYGGSTSIPEPHFVDGPPAVILINSNADTGDGQVVENERTSAAITQLLVVFNKDMNADTPGDLDDALTVGNYSLVQGGSTVIPINPVITYNAGTRTATLDVNGGAPLPDGAYTLTVLGRIEDTLGVPIGTDFVRVFTVTSIFDDTDPGWTYTGVWTAATAIGPYNGTDRYSNDPTATAAFTFDGSGFNLKYVKASNRGSLEVWIDGVKVDTIYAYSPTLVWQAIYSKTGLIPGLHTVIFKHGGMTGKFIDIDSIQILTASAPGIYDDTDPAWTYLGAWTPATTTGPYNSTDRYSNDAAASASLMFTGSSFHFKYVKASNRGKIDVWVDDVKVDTINAYSPTLVWQAVYTRTGLSAGIHTVVFKPGGPSGYFIDIDSFEILPPDTLPPDDVAGFTAAPGTITGSVDLSWTAPSDDAGSPASGAVASYLVKYSTSAFTNWADGTLVTSGLPAPLAPGDPQTLTLSGLTPDTLYYFAIRAQDEQPNLSVHYVTASANAKPLTAVGLGLYDDTDLAWIYTGTWRPATTTGPYNGTDRYSNDLTATASLMFTGSGFHLKYVKYFNRGNIEVWIDGVKVDTIYAYGSALTWQAAYTRTGLTAGTHTVVFKHGGPAGYFIDIDSIQVLAAAGAGIYDDTDPAWAYAGAWTPVTATGPYNNTDRYSNDPMASASFLFSGSGFHFKYLTFANRGKIEVWIDGVKVDTINAYSVMLTWQAVYTRTGLTPGTHTVVFMHAGPGGTFIDIDSLEILP